MLLMLFPPSPFVRFSNIIENYRKTVNLRREKIFYCRKIWHCLTWKVNFHWDSDKSFYRKDKCIKLPPLLWAILRASKEVAGVTSSWQIITLALLMALAASLRSSVFKSKFAPATITMIFWPIKNFWTFILKIKQNQATTSCSYIHP